MLYDRQLRKYLIIALLLIAIAPASSLAVDLNFGGVKANPVLVSDAPAIIYASR